MKWSELVQMPVFRLLGIIAFLSSLGVLGIVFHFVPLLTDAGLSATDAGTIASVIGIAVIAGRVFTGLLLDRYPAPRVAASLFGLSAVGLITLAVGGAAFALPGALAIGLTVGAEVDLISYLTSRYFPLSSYGSAFGALFAIYIFGVALAPAIAGYQFDMSQNYTGALLLAATWLVIAAAVVQALPTLSQGAKDRELKP